MSSISTIYDTLRVRMATIFPDHKELPYNQTINLNDGLFLTQGWAVYFADAINTNRLLSCQLSLSRNVNITLSRKVFGLDRDVTTRVTVEKNLLEDHLILIKDIEKDPDLNGAAAKILYISDLGIQTLFSEQMHYLYIQTIFSIEYFENLN